MNGETIKSFLVGLGFEVDEGSFKEFTKSLAVATLKVTALYASIKIAAAGIFAAISKVSESFEDIGYQFRIISPMINKTLELRNAMLAAWKAAGINITSAVQASVKFNFSLAKTKYALDAIYKSVGVKFLPLLTKQMDIFRGKIYANMPKIQAALERFINFIFKAFEATTILGARVWSILGRIYDFFKGLDEATGGWSTKILAAIAAWRLLNLAFLATPLGLILTGLVAILALWDDFKVWEEGGKSLFDWSYALPIITSLSKYMGDLRDILGDVFRILLGLVDAFKSLVTLDLAKFKESLKNIWEDAKAAGGHIGNAATNLVGAGSSTGYGSLLAAANPAYALASMISQKLHQETNITVQGSADASATGRAVASEQSKVNFDMVRNLKGATQ